MQQCRHLRQASNLTIPRCARVSSIPFPMQTDNHYVPNLTIGPMVCKALRGERVRVYIPPPPPPSQRPPRLSPLPDYGVTKDIDVHLMVQPVDSMINDFAKAGASYITFHPEASNHVDRSLGLIRSMGCKSGLVLTPSTSLEYCK